RASCMRAISVSAILSNSVTLGCERLISWMTTYVPLSPAYTFLARLPADSSSNSASIASFDPPTPCILAWRGDGPRRLTLAAGTVPNDGNTSFDASITTGGGGAGGVEGVAALPDPAPLPAEGLAASEAGVVAVPAGAGVA